MRKAKREQIPEHFWPIKTRPYAKNLSFARIFSHKQFAKDAFRKIEEQDPDLIWLMAPANFLILEAKRYKERYPKKKLVIDIIDMWPESLPIHANKNIFPFSLWRKIRSKNIGCCDMLVSECDLYKKILEKEYPGKIETIRWARDGKAIETEPKVPEGTLSLCYLGSINNIIDTKKIQAVIREISMPVLLHVIGEGENTEAFLDAMKEVCTVEYHGAIRDEERKKKIFESCHAGINIYKEGLYIGLTVKCIDYFQHGLPIINNIKGDTWDLVNAYDAGINVGDGSKIDGRKLIERRKNNKRIRDLFDECLSKEVFMKKCQNVIDEVSK
ncbi:MAG: hypothetical protein K5648_04815 [Erysipelotrichaceae bacterium]|nr:hypothetical protein [Erysipelotrichaceae bacterium]